MTKKHISALSFFLAAIILISALCTVSVSASEPSSPSLDFSDPSAAVIREISPSELLSLITGEAVPRAETEYLDTYSDHILSVTDGFSNDTISLRYLDGALTVTARVYSYLSAGGSAVRWTPEYAEIDGERTPLSSNDGEKYVCTIQNVEQREGARVSVRYSCTLSISKERANALTNLAFNDATEAVRLEEEYHSVLGEYLESYRRYEKYLEDVEIYEENLEKYNEYLTLKSEYEKDKAAYEKYLVTLADYNAKLKNYNDYLSQYDNYLDAKAEYERIYAENSDSMDEYIKYYTELNKVRSSMYAMESLFVKPDSGHTNLFTALQNKEMIDLFKKYKDLLTIYKVSGETVDKLSTFTDELNELLRRYSVEREKSEQAAFEFYRANYVEIRDKFNYLYDTMVDIMTPTLFNHMCTKIEIDYKNDPEKAQYIQHRTIMVLAQTYLVYKCLDDNESASGSWDFYNYSGKKHTYAFSELISQNVIITDTNAASPEGLVWPTNVPDFVLPPLPQEPEKVAKPLEPSKVDEPTAPDAVSKPTAPDVVEHPGKAPSGLEDLLKTAVIVDALKAGELSVREEFSADVAIELSHTASKLISFENKPVMTVYGYDMSAPVMEKIITSPSDISLPESEPIREPDKKYVYSFRGWSVSPTELVPPTDENTPDAMSDFCIYAIYLAEEKVYTITWVTATGEFTETYSYGSIPTFSGDTAKPSSNTTVYTFERWSPTPSIVTKDETYTAQYSASERKYSVSWVLPEKTVTKNYSYNEVPDQPSFNKIYVSGLSRFVFTGWDKTISTVSADVTYTALFRETVLLSSQSGRAELTSGSSAYYLTLPDTTFDIENLIALAASENKRIEINAGGVNIYISQDTLSSLSMLGAKTFSVNAKTDSIADAICSLTVTDKNGSPVVCDKEIRLSLSFSLAANKNLHVYSIISSGALIDTPYSVENGRIIFGARANSNFTFKQLYSVTISPDENGGAMLDGYVWEAGDKLTLSLYPATGYTVSTITVTRSDNGTSKTLESLDELVMPDSDITISVKFEKLSYTVSFVLNGEVISSEKYPIGEMPIPPTIEQEFEQDGYRYVFAGWSPSMQSVTKDATYTAKYNRFLLDVAPPADTGNAFHGFLRQTVLPAAAITLMTGAGIFALVFLLRTRKKSKATNKK